jgi:hypothetical protein
VSDIDDLERTLKEDLETIKRYKELMARRGGAAAGKVVGATPAKGASSATTLTQAIDDALTSEWQTVAAIMAAVQSRREFAKADRRQTYANTLERLVDRGSAEKRGNRQEGVEYRKKPTA